MDISKYNARERAEDGVFVGLCDPYTKEPIVDEDGSAPGFVVRGVASKTVQDRLAPMQRKAKEPEDEENMKAVLEQLHQSQIETAMGYIVRAENLSIDGKDVGGKASMIRKVLDMTFPDMKIATDENGVQLTTTVTDDKGVARSIPKLEIVNDTFAGQVIRAAEDGARFFGKTADD